MPKPSRLETEMRQKPGIQIGAMALLALIAAVMVWLALAQLTAKRAEELQGSAQPQGRSEGAGPLSAPSLPPAARTAIPPDAPQDGDDRVVFLELHGPRPGHSAFVRASAARAQVGADGAIPFPGERARASTGTTWVLCQGHAPTRVPRVEPGASEPESLELKRGSTLELRVASASAEATLGVELFPDPPMGLPQELHATVGRVCDLLKSVHLSRGERAEGLSEPEFNALLHALERDDRLVLQRLSAVLNGARSLPCGGRIWRGLSDGMRYRLRYTSEDFAVVPSASGEGLAVMPDGGFAVSSKAFTSPSNVSGEIRLGVDEHRVLTTSVVEGASITLTLGGSVDFRRAWVNLKHYEYVSPKVEGGPRFLNVSKLKAIELTHPRRVATFLKVPPGQYRPYAVVMETDSDIWFLDTELVDFVHGDYQIVLTPRGDGICRIEVSVPQEAAHSPQVLSNTTLGISISRFQIGGPHQVAYAASSSPTGHTTIHGLPEGDYTLRLRYELAWDAPAPHTAGAHWDLRQKYAALSHEEKFRIDDQTREVLVRWTPAPD